MSIVKPAKTRYTFKNLLLVRIEIMRRRHHVVSVHNIGPAEYWLIAEARDKSFVVGFIRPLIESGRPDPMFHVYRLWPDQLNIVGSLWLFLDGFW